MKLKAGGVRDEGATRKTRPFDDSPAGFDIKAAFKSA
jgi:hypothetical protein